MKILRASQTEQFVHWTNEWCQDRVAKTAAKLLFLPSGNTPIDIYQNWEKKSPQFLQNLQFTQLDEVITGPLAGSFANFFLEHLPSYKQQFTKLEEQSADPDLVILGIGVNGHVAFHEPSQRQDFYKGKVVLEDSTCDRAKTPRGTQGLTYGVACFLRAKAILMLVKGTDKKAITERLINETSADFPAALLKKHPDFTLIIANEVLSNP